MKEIGRQTQTYAEQLQSLQDLLKNPKQRGILGEYYLETVLKNVMSPEDYRIQYPFKNGEIVDAVIVINKKLVPVDSKFSLDNYNRFVGTPVGSPRARYCREGIRERPEAAHYGNSKVHPSRRGHDGLCVHVHPERGNLLRPAHESGGGREDENLIQRAASKHKVIIVSPTSFLAYLQTVMQGLKALEIEKACRGDSEARGRAR